MGEEGGLDAARDPKSRYINDAVQVSYRMHRPLEMGRLYCESVRVASCVDVLSRVR